MAMPSLTDLDTAIAYDSKKPDAEDGALNDPASTALSHLSVAHILK